MEIKLNAQTEIKLNAPVECADGDSWQAVGHSAYLLINPVIDQVTHLVVKEDSSSNTEYIVPVEMIAETTADTIRLRCNMAELEMLKPFVKTEFVQEILPDYSGFRGGMGSYYMPYVTPDIAVQVPVETQQIPPGDLAVRRGTRVEATDGFVGKVDEFVVNPENSHITHLVMREGHLWGKKDVIIPLSALEDSNKDTVFLKINKHQIESLPTFPTQRHWS